MAEYVDHITFNQLRSYYEDNFRVGSFTFWQTDRNVFSFNLKDMYEAVLGLEMRKSELSPDSIESILLWGSAAKPCYSIIPEHKEKIIFNWKMTVPERIVNKDYPHDLDLLVITNDGSYSAQKQAVFNDLSYSGRRSGAFHINSATYADFRNYLENRTHYGKEIFRDGIVLADNGFFQEMEAAHADRLERNPQYQPRWWQEDIERHPLGSDPIVVKEDVLYGKNRFIGTPDLMQP
ncbi:MAG: hypothetical protein ACLFTH_04025 [Candidatus Woesearchaeota archaeon]